MHSILQMMKPCLHKAKKRNNSYCISSKAHGAGSLHFSTKPKAFKIPCDTKLKPVELCFCLKDVFLCTKHVCVCVCVRVCVHTRTHAPTYLFQRGIKVGRGNEDGQVITLPFKILKRGIYDNHIVIYLLKHKNMEA